MPSMLSNMEARSARLPACAALRTSPSRASMALRSRFVTSLRVLSCELMAGSSRDSGLYQRVARSIGPHTALGGQFLEVRGKRAGGHAVDAARHVVVDRGQQVLD